MAKKRKNKKKQTIQTKEKEKKEEKDIPVKNKNTKEKESKDEEKNTKKQDKKSKPDYKTPGEFFYNKKKIQIKKLDAKIKKLNNKNIDYPIRIVSDSFNNEKFDVEKDNRLIFNLGVSKIQENIIGLIKNAKNMICMSSFLIENNTKIIKELYRASDRDVRIYVIGAFENAVDKYNEDEENIRAIGHVDFLKTAGNGFMYIRAGDLHAKYIIADPKTKPAGILMSSNITDRATTKNNEIAINLNAHEVKELFDTFIYAFDQEVKHEYVNDEKNNEASLKTIKPVGAHYPSHTNILFTSKKDTEIKDKIKQSLIHHKPDKIYLSSWNFKEDCEICEDILKYINGKTQVLLPYRKQNFDAAKKMLDKGAKVRFNRLQHAKFLLCDKFAILSSANFEKQGLNEGFEVGIYLDKPEEIRKLKEIFKIWFDNAEEIAYRQLSLKKVAKTPMKLLKEDKPTNKFKKKTTETIESKISAMEYFDMLNNKELIEKQAEKIVNQKMINPNVYENIFQVQFSVERPPSDLIFHSEIEKIPIWKRNSKRKKEKFILINEVPQKASKKYEKIKKLSIEQNASIYIY